MAVALYSEIARADIVDGAGLHRRARLWFERPTTSGAAGRTSSRTRAGRRFKNVSASRDFFSTSDCRDLLFHVQEHRPTSPQIAVFLAENELDFLGFESIRRREPVSHEAFPRRQGDDRSGSWDAFERSIPARSPACTSSGCRSRFRNFVVIS